MTCGLSQGLQDISSSFTSMKDELNEKMTDAAAAEFPALGKGIGANISEMKADMETAMADLKEKLDVVIPEISVQLPNLQTAAEEAANALKSAAASVNPDSIAAFQAQAAAKFEEIRSTWGSTATPGVNIEQVISDVGQKFSSMDFCTECPNLDLREVGVDEGTGLPIYETIKKGITANTSIVDTTEPKKAVDKKLIEIVKPILVASGADGVPVKTAKNDPNPSPTTAVETSNKPESVIAAPKPQPKVTGGIQSKEGLANVSGSGIIESEIMFVPRRDSKGYTWWAPVGYDTQFEYEKAWASRVMSARRHTASRINWYNKLISFNSRGSKDDPDHPFQQKRKMLETRLGFLNKINILGGEFASGIDAGGSAGTLDEDVGGNNKALRKRPFRRRTRGKKSIFWTLFDDPKHWDEVTDCPKPLHEGTEDLDVFGTASKKGYEFIPPPGNENFETTKPSWDANASKWVWESQTRTEENTTGIPKTLSA